MSYPDLSLLYTTLKRLQALAVTGTRYALACVEGEQRTMGRALDVLFLNIEKLIDLPLQPNAAVGAGVNKSARLVSLSYYQQREFSKLEAPRARVLQLIEFTQEVIHKVPLHKAPSLLSGASLTRGLICV